MTQLNSFNLLIAPPFSSNSTLFQSFSSTRSSATHVLLLLGSSAPILVFPQRGGVQPGYRHRGTYGACQHACHTAIGKWQRTGEREIPRETGESGRG